MRSTSNIPLICMKDGDGAILSVKVVVEATKTMPTIIIIIIATVIDREIKIETELITR